MKLDQDDVTRAVGERYAAGAQAVEAELCCPVDYDARWLEVLPEEMDELRAMVDKWRPYL